MTTSAQQNFADAMINTAQDAYVKGEDQRAMNVLTTFINGIESNDRKTQSKFGPSVVQMYCFRAKIAFEKGGAAAQGADYEQAKSDVTKAEQALDFVWKLDPAKKEGLRAHIRNLLNPDGAARGSSYMEITKLLKEVPAKPQIQVNEIVYQVVIGSVLWMFPLVMVILGLNTSRDGLYIAGILIGLVLVVMSMIGWDNFPIGGGGGGQLKIIAVFLIAATGVGLCMIVFWTGRCVWNWMGRR